MVSKNAKTRARPANILASWYAAVSITPNMAWLCSLPIVTLHEKVGTKELTGHLPFYL